MKERERSMAESRKRIAQEENKAMVATEADLLSRMEELFPFIFPKPVQSSTISFWKRP